MAQITGTPDYHFLYVDPNLGGEWLFDAARSFWDHFRPTVLTDFEFLRLVPAGKLLAVTVIARRDSISQIGVALAKVRPDALLDPVAQDTLDLMRTTLNGRADNNLPYGRSFEPTQPAGQQVNPTPGSVLGGPLPTRAPSGFITETPTMQPTSAPPPSAAPAEPTLPLPTLPEGSEPTRVPIEPTPGSVLGG